jgi:hypothetical protein
MAPPTVLRVLFPNPHFVAPEWWMPRRHSQLDMRVNIGDPQVSLTDDDIVRCGGADARGRDNYRIT